MNGLHNGLTTCFLVIYIAQKPIYYGPDGINVFQGPRTIVINQIYDNCAPNSLRIHCMAHPTLSNANLIKLAFGDLPWTFVTNHAKLLCTFTQEAFKVYKVSWDLGNEGE
jgi:hypothetical protein